MSTMNLDRPQPKVVLLAISAVVLLHVLTAATLALVKTPVPNIESLKITPPLEIEMVTLPPLIEIEEIKMGVKVPETQETVSQETVNQKLISQETQPIEESKPHSKSNTEEPKLEQSKEPLPVLNPKPFKPEQLQPELFKPEPFKPEPARPQQFEPEPVQPELFKPEKLEPEPVQPEPIEPEPVQPALLGGTIVDEATVYTRIKPSNPNPTSMSNNTNLSSDTSTGSNDINLSAGLSNPNPTPNSSAGSNNTNLSSDSSFESSNTNSSSNTSATSNNTSSSSNTPTESNNNAPTNTPPAEFTVNDGDWLKKPRFNLSIDLAQRYSIGERVEVTLLLQIGTDGRIKSATVVNGKSSGNIKVDRQATNQVKTGTFSPAVIERTGTLIVEHTINDN